jgi:hypothetical protein
MRCALVAPKGPNFRRTIKVRNWEERLREGAGVNEVDFKTELNNTGVWLYILTREVRPMSIHKRKIIQKIESPGGNLKHPPRGLLRRSKSDDEHAWHITHENRINRTTFIRVSSLFDFPPSLLPQADHFFHILITLSANYRPHGID